VSSDRARISFDSSRHWRSVISQQGRVSVEADANEANSIATVSRRAALIETIGPSGTPDDGYRVLPGDSGSVAGDLTIQPGVLYVGGERMELDVGVDYASQPDWIDSDGDPLWVDPAIPDGGGSASVYLLLREQEVGAVEDPALLEVALGGPDTAARSRILQRIVRTSTTATNCVDALTALEEKWATAGQLFEPGTMLLRSQATLQVSYQQPPTIATLCQPGGQGGYLGAENQLIRVQVASVDSDGMPTLVWGYDNASFMYRISGALTEGATTLTLASAPVDSYHQPQSGQAVEILQAAAQLTDSDYIAASSGMVTMLTAPYATDTQQVELADGLTAAQAASPLLFMRVWQGTLPWSAAPLPLDGTGVQITVGNAGATWHVGDYWSFAVRPGTPSTVSPIYPERIVDSPQPPNGPTMWACPLGLVTWPSSGGTPTIGDCRAHFDDLVTLTEESKGECTISVRPDDVNEGAGLQSLVDSLANSGPSSICLQPGTYTLPSPLVIRAGADPLTIECCLGGAVLQAVADTSTPPTSAVPFTLGLIVAESAAQLTLRGLKFSLPSVPFQFAADAIGGLPSDRQALLTTFGNDMMVGFGVGVLSGTNVKIEACTFDFPDVTTVNLLSAGVLATGTVNGLELTECSFTATEPTTTPFSDVRLGNEAAPPYQALYGYLHLPSQAAAQPAPTPTNPSTGEFIREPIEATEVGREKLTARAISSRPIGTEPIGTQPIATEPISTGPIKTGPIETGPISTGPISTGPISTGPIVGHPIGPIVTGPIGPIIQPPPIVVDPAPSLTPAVLENARFALNTFDGVTVPILVLGGMGVVTVNDNTVRASYGGFWLLPADSDTAIAMLDRLDSTNATVATFAVGGGIAALTDPALWLATAICRLLPQTPPTAGIAVPITLIHPPNLTILTNAAGILGLLSGSVETVAAPVTGPPVAEEKPAPKSSRAVAAEKPSSRSRAAGEKPTRRRTSRAAVAEEPIAEEPIAATGLGALHFTLPPNIGTIFQQPGAAAGPAAPPAADEGAGATPRINLTANQVDAVIENTYSGTVLLVAVMLTDLTIVPSTLCTGNRLRGRVSSGPTVSLNQIPECTLIGNVISNEIVDSSANTSVEPSTPPSQITTCPSVVLQPPVNQATALVAVTGNVLIGDGPALPVRPLPMPFNVWDPLNTIVGYIAPAAPVAATPGS
jgi:hypothetical protein